MIDSLTLTSVQEGSHTPTQTHSLFAEFIHNFLTDSSYYLLVYLMNFTVRKLLRLHPHRRHVWALVCLHRLQAVTCMQPGNLIPTCLATSTEQRSILKTCVFTSPKSLQRLIFKKENITKTLVLLIQRNQSNAVLFE